MRDLGLGAEEVAAVEPLLVTYNSKGEVEGVKYDRIAVVLLNAVKEQQEQILQQTTQIAELKSQMAEDRAKHLARVSLIERKLAELLRRKQPFGSVTNSATINSNQRSKR